MGKKSDTLDALVSMCIERDGPGKNFYEFTKEEVNYWASEIGFANSHDVPHIDCSAKISPLMKEHGLCIYHLGKREGERLTRHAFVSPSDSGFHHLEPISEDRIYDLEDMRPGPLDETSTSEATILSIVYNHGILREFLYGDDLQASPQIYISHRSRKNTGHRIGDMKLPLGKIQFEVDMTFENDGLVTVFEGKNYHKNRDDFAIYQLYMPYRHYEIISRENPEFGIKEINCCYLIRKKMSWGSKIYAYMYEFDEPEDLTSIRFIKNAQYNLIYRGRMKE